MLFMHNNKYLPLTGLAYLLCCSELYIIHREIFEIFQKYFMKYFRAKTIMKFYITICRTKRRAQSLVISYFRFRFTAAYN